MEYTIARMESRNISLNIDRIGNEYLVGLWDKENHSSTTKRFGTIELAYKVFEKISSWLVFGYFSNEDIKTYLKTGTME